MNIKEILKDKLVDNMFELFTDTSIEEMDELLEYKKLQKILCKSMDSFYNCTYFKEEFKNVSYELDEGCVYNINNEKLNPANTVEQISTSIYEVIKACFFSNYDIDYEKISTNVASIYLQRAKFCVRLYDVIKTQHYEFSQLSEDISEMQKEILSKFNEERLLRIEKESLLIKELNNEVLNMFNNIIQMYITLVTKGSPKFELEDGDDIKTAMIKKIEDLTCNIDLYITKDFFNIPVTITVANGFCRESKDIPYQVYSEMYFRKCILIETEKLLKYKDIMELQLFILILRLRNELQSDFFMPLIEMGQTNILNNKNIKINVLQFQSEYKKIGEIILNIYKYVS